jgi:hypothetical protein
MGDVYLAGVINGGLRTGRLFIENTRHHAKVIIDLIDSKRSIQNDLLSNPLKAK